MEIPWYIYAIIATFFTPFAAQSSSVALTNGAGTATITISTSPSTSFTDE